MSDLFRSRLSRHARMLLRYLRLVFNDHFVIALMFFVGGLGLAYSNWLKALPPHSGWLRWVILVGLLVGLQIGRLATLLENADPVFLLPREHDLHTYLQRAKNYSLTMAAFMQVGIVALFIPLILVIERVPSWALLCVVLTQLLLKNAWMTERLSGLYQHSNNWRWFQIGTEWVLPVIILTISTFGLPLVGTVLALLLAGAWRFNHQRQWSHYLLAWKKDVASESNRMLGIYRFFNLFTDVPMVHGTVKRRAYLDVLLRGMRFNQKNTFTYLFARGMIRGTEFSGLFIRLTLIGIVLIYFLPGGWLMLLLNALFIYLIGFQLLPFYKQYDNIVFTHLYPITKKNKLFSFQKIMAILLSVTAVLFLAAAIISNAAITTVAVLLVIDLVEIYLLVAWYARLRLA